MQVLSKWSPDPVKCDYCWTKFRFDEQDITFKGNSVYVDCPQCVSEIEVCEAIPRFWVDAAKERV